MSELKSGSNLEKVLNAGHFAFTGECGPPKGANVEHLKEKLSHLKGHVDAVNMTDNQTAVVRMSSMAGSALIGFRNSDCIEVNEDTVYSAFLSAFCDSTFDPLWGME